MTVISIDKWYKHIIFIYIRTKLVVNKSIIHTALFMPVKEFDTLQKCVEHSM